MWTESRCLSVLFFGPGISHWQYQFELMFCFRLNFSSGLFLILIEIKESFDNIRTIFTHQRMLWKREFDGKPRDLLLSRFLVDLFSVL